MDFNNNGGMYMPVAPAGTNGGFGSDWAWIIILLLCGWGGNGFGGNNNSMPWILNGQQNTDNLVSSGFRDSMLSDGISSISDKVTSGYGDLQTALCGGFAGVNATTNAVGNNITGRLYDDTIASLERSYAAQTAVSGGFANVSQQLSQCCCDNRLATSQTQNLISTEAASTRAAIQAQTQAILDKLCQQEIDAKNDRIAALERELSVANLAASQTAQSAYIISQLKTTA